VYTFVNNTADSTKNCGIAASIKFAKTMVEVVSLCESSSFTTSNLE
jgi:hypothetical protein